MIEVKLEDTEYKVRYSMQLRNKFSFVSGNSATGKSTLISLIRRWNILKSSGRISNTKIVSNVDIFAPESLDSLGKTKGALYVFDEYFTDVLRKNKSVLLKSPNYFLIVDRAYIDLPFGVYDMFEVVSERDNDGYISNELMLKFRDMIDEDVMFDLAITEDYASGYKFFKNCLVIKCKSAKGKTRVVKSVKTSFLQNINSILVIVDEVGFGYEFIKLIELCSKYRKLGKTVYLWLPKSFEYMLLSSGMFEGISDFLRDPYASWDLSKFGTVEQYITHIFCGVMKRKFGVNYSKGLDVTSYFKDYTLLMLSKNVGSCSKILK